MTRCRTVPEQRRTPLHWPQPIVAEKGANLSPLTKGGYRGVVERCLPEGFGLEFTPPNPPFVRGGAFDRHGFILVYGGLNMTPEFFSHSEELP